MKTIIKKSVGGFCIGVTLGVIISLVFAKLWANGGYVPSTPAFMAQYAIEWSAMLVSVILWGGWGSSLRLPQWFLSAKLGVY